MMTDPDKIEQAAAGPDKVEQAAAGPDKFANCDYQLKMAYGI